MKWDTILTKNNTKLQQIERTGEDQEWNLEVPSGKGSGSRSKIIHHDTETPIREVGPKPLQS